KFEVYRVNRAPVSVTLNKKRLRGAAQNNPSRSDHEVGAHPERLVNLPRFRLRLRHIDMTHERLRGESVYAPRSGGGGEYADDSRIVGRGRREFVGIEFVRIFRFHESDQINDSHAPHLPLFECLQSLSDRVLNMLLISVSLAAERALEEFRPNLVLCPAHPGASALSPRTGAKVI